ncbi:MAG: hypothetical protein MJ252_19985 [archaeon]|nr:hypothetical protein [archaeon]
MNIIYLIYLSCNKIKCRFCLINEYDTFTCRNNCKKNLYQSALDERKKKNRCSVCLKCPLCSSILHAKNYTNKNAEGKDQSLFLSECPNCKWNTTEIAICKDTEMAYSVQLTQLEEKFTEGLLSNIFENSLKKLKETLKENEEKAKSYKETTSFMDLEHDTVVEAMSNEVWDMSKLEESLKQKEKEFNDKMAPLTYNDDYLSSKEGSVAVFGFIKPFLSCTLDYEEKKYLKYDKVEDLVDNIKNYFELEHTASFEQRLENIALQSPLKSKLFPTFAEMVPQKDKMRRKCKECGKNVIMPKEIPTKSGESKFDYAFFYISYFPVISIYKVDAEQKQIQIKFTKLDAKDISIKIQEDEENKCSVELPTEKYEIGTLDSTENKDKFIVKQTDQYLILNFTFSEEYASKLEKDTQHLLSFKVAAEYTRDSDTPSTLNYKVEIKFTIQ